MKIIADSHTDHALTPEHIAFILSRFQDRTAFFLETIEIPHDLPSVRCSLHGPRMGDAPIPDAECTMVVRGGRAGASRVCARPARDWRMLTVIGGPHGEEPCVLYTAFGGPVAPCEPWDETLTPEGRKESIAFWAEHALSP